VSVSVGFCKNSKAACKRTPSYLITRHNDQLRNYFNNLLFIDTDCDFILGESVCNGDARKLVAVISTEALGPFQYCARETIVLIKTALSNFIIAGLPDKIMLLASIDVYQYIMTRDK